MQNIRHVIAHTIPFDDGYHQLDDNYFNNKSQFSPKHSSIIFQDILSQIYNEYKEIHGREIIVEDYAIQGKEFWNSSVVVNEY